LSVLGNTSIKDVQGIKLDGDFDTVAGGDYVRFFAIAALGVDLPAAYDSGINDTDDITNITRPQLAVTVNEAGTIVIDWDNPGVADTILEVTGGGVYPLMPATDLAAGIHEIDVNFTNTEEEFANAIFTLTIDTTPPTADNASITVDTGIDGNDRLTRDTTPAISIGFSEEVYGSNDALEVLDQNESEIVPDAITGFGSDTLLLAFTDTELGLEGQYAVVFHPDAARIADIAGNILDVGSSIVPDFIIDSTPPDIVIVTPAEPVVQLESTFEATGTAVDDNGLEVVEYNVNDTGWFTAAGAASWSFTANLILGDNVILIRAYDLAGNLTPPVAVPVITQTRAPITYVVAENGGDFITIQAAIDMALPGDTVSVRQKATPYFEKLHCPLDGHAIVGAITLQAYPDEHPVVNGAGVNGQNLVLIDGRRYIRIIGMTLQNNSEPGQVSGAGIAIINNSANIHLADNIVANVVSDDPQSVEQYSGCRCQLGDYRAQSVLP
jgi:hypothetical protein